MPFLGYEVAKYK